MLDFSLSDEQLALQALGQRFSRERIMPIAARCDVEARFPTELLAEAHEIGLLQALVPEAYGGGGIRPLEHALIVEALSYGCSGIETSLLGSSLAISALCLAATEDQMRKVFGAIVSEPTLVSLAVTEPDAGSDVAGIRTRCRRVGNDWVLEGQKSWITNATLSRYFVVFATLDPAARQRGIAAFIVPRDARGLEVGRPERKLGQRASDTASLRLDAVTLPPGAMLAPPDHGFKLAMAVFERTRPDIAAIATGLMARALDESVAYSELRRTFGKQLRDHQLVAASLAEMSIACEAARLLYRRAAWGIDRGGIPSFSSHAKAFAADQAVRVAASAVQIFGACGYSCDYPVEKLYRDAKVLQIYEGTSEIQRLIIARQLRHSVEETR